MEERRETLRGADVDPEIFEDPKGVGLYKFGICGSVIFEGMRFDREQAEKNLEYLRKLKEKP